MTTDTVNEATRAAYARWLALRKAGDTGASAAFSVYMAAREAEAAAYIASRKR